MRILPTSVKELRRLLVLCAVLVAVLLAVIVYDNYDDQKDNQAKERDAQRVSYISGMSEALRDYALKHGTFPNCLYSKDGCAALEDDAEFTSRVHKDPFTELPFNYASYAGQGTVCNGYHLGTSLERTASQALLTGSDAPPKSQNVLCKGSETDFSGLSSSLGGYPCGTDVGTAQPTDAADGETCFDIQRTRLP